MFKFAHSLSIAFGFMVACVQSVCGIDKPFETSYRFSSENGASAKISGQILKNLATKGQTARQDRRNTSPIKLGEFQELSPSVFAELESGIIPKSTNKAELKILADVSEFPKDIKKEKAHRIRAP